MKTERGQRHTFLACDIENNPDTGAFICAALYGDIKEKKNTRVGRRVVTSYVKTRVDEYFTSLEALHTFVLALPAGCCTLAFYNLGYDKEYFDAIIDAPTQTKRGELRPAVLTIGTRVITVRLKNGLKCMDLFNHTMMGSLEDWIKYCKMEENHGVFKPDLKDLKLRVTMDTKATYHLGVFLQDFYNNECNTPMRLTVGASALQMFQKLFFRDYWTRDDEYLSYFERQSYYGGRTELFKRGEWHHFSYDINSMYVSIMRDNLFPDMSSGVYVADGYNYETHALGDKLAILKCHMKAPDDLHIPVLPVRIDGKLKFPLGEFTGVWTSPLIKKALSLGYKIIQCFEYVYYRNAKPYFKDFAEFVWNKRAEYKKVKNKGMDDMIKRIGNALYGKFAQRNGTETLCRLRDFPAMVTPDCEIFEYKGETWVIQKGEKTPARFEFPAIASFITSYAQLKLYEALETYSDDIIYCDTDSVKIARPADDNLTIGKNLGEWGFEYEKTATFYRPKFYDDKHKGVPKRAGEVCHISDRDAHINNNVRHKVFVFQRPTREREAMRRGLIANQWLWHEKILTFNDDKRVWSGDESKPYILC